ncbi:MULTISPECIES: CHAT domain-containing protein [Moorena]|uniref:CHAT domain-containing protein n=1 Tax=Moorena TaxID=1155738 RepID=UPI00096A5DC9|nr:MULTISPECIES: CHAT domain-containing protein [Moorena]NEO19072.1 CHAT domain-containing protein [Moorena sp. SIO4A5]NEQ56414.1 CHAT domain-containing protein [Moorena sp. SIO4A1]
MGRGSLTLPNRYDLFKALSRLYRIRFLRGKVTKAEALRLAQLELLQSEAFNLPLYWSAFILLGNWL